jgi:hypothetical protein
MATVTSEDGATVLEVPDSNRFLLDYYRGEGYSVVTDEEAAAVGAPAKSATKADWVAFAVALGADEAEAEVLTKAELIEQYGG